MAALRIVHDKWAGVKDEADDRAEFLAEFDMAKEHNPEIGQYRSKAQEDINPLRALDIFERISDEVWSTISQLSWSSLRRRDSQ